MMATSSTLHKSRKGKQAHTVRAEVQSRDGPLWIDSATKSQRPAFPLASFFWPAKRAVSQWVVLPALLSVVALFYWTPGLWGYSGLDAPPMYGDFEAQRHWMEITAHLPISNWYFYDLQYWGLDYPPLTAYHSWLMGRIGSILNPDWFALDASRGLEAAPLKVFMRSTVLMGQFLIYVPAAVILTRKIGRFYGLSSWHINIALAAVLLQPATILIDNAHFQFNTIMLGLVLASVASMISQRYAWGCVYFVGALMYKQMALYYAPVVFAYLIGVSTSPKLRPKRFLIIALTTLAAFGLILAPLLLGGLLDQQRGISLPLSVRDRKVNPLLQNLSTYVNPKAAYYPVLVQLTQMVHRIFPFARGIFEDKVANFWCCIHTLHKLHEYPMAMLQRISTSATLVSILPACMIISLFPQTDLILWALASCAWGFFLCSFQVHEKSVLLPLLPITTMLAGEGGLGVEMRSWIGWINLLAVWTMYPLLKRDGLSIPYAILSALWAYLLGIPPFNYECYFGSRVRPFRCSLVIRTVHLLFYAAMLVWHALEYFVAPPQNKPDLWVVLNVAIGTAGFAISYLWCTWNLIMRCGIMTDWSEYRREQDGKSEEDRAKALPLPWQSSKPSAREKSPVQRVKLEGTTSARLSSASTTSASMSPSPSPSPSKRRSTRSKKK